MKKDNPYYDESMWKGAPADNFARAQKLRAKMTDAEKFLWERLKGNTLNGLNFRRQHPIHRFIVDFYCYKLKLIIEVDGKYHETNEQQILDADRSELLEFQNTEIIRFTNDEILNDIDEVVKAITVKIDSIVLQKGQQG